MSPHRTLVADDFRKQPRGPYLFDRWLAVPSLDTPLGKLNVDLRNPPDDELVAIANTLAGLLACHADAVLAAAHRNYEAACYDEGWMDACEVPTGLAADELRPYLSDPTIVVDRTRGGKTTGVIYFSPQWDTEHGLYLRFVDGRVVQTQP